MANRSDPSSDCLNECITALDQFLWLYEHSRGDFEGLRNALRRIYDLGLAKGHDVSCADTLAKMAEANGLDCSCIYDLLEVHLPWFECAPEGYLMGRLNLADVRMVLNLARRLKARQVAPEEHPAGGIAPPQGRRDEKGCCPSPAAPSGTRPRPRRRGEWPVTRTESEVARYLSERMQQYWQLGQACLDGKRGAVDRFQKVFGPTAIADGINQSLDVVEKAQRCKKQDVLRTSAYKARIQPLTRTPPCRPEGWRPTPEDTDASAQDILADIHRSDAP